MNMIACCELKALQRTSCELKALQRSYTFHTL